MAENWQIICHIKDYIQPFERALAEKELAALTGSTPSLTSDAGAYFVRSEMAPTLLASRLAYWEKVGTAASSCEGILTRQVHFEATAEIAKNGTPISALQLALPFRNTLPLPNYRSLRYGPHGIHEYRGKFFPQLVRALLNVAELPKGATVLDPMCGSGTAVVESNLLGMNAVGMDINPLSVLMTKAKSAILHISPSLLEDEYHTLVSDVTETTAHATDIVGLRWFGKLSAHDQDYLLRWFPERVLIDLDPIMMRVQDTANNACRSLFLIALSNILRSVSWQKEEDLRVRKEVTDTDINVLDRFLFELDQSVKSVLALLYELRHDELGSARVVQGDARELDVTYSSSIDAIVTSPPYATALPYLDTDRLSLIYLDLLRRSQHRRYNYHMIGNREINKGQRVEYWQHYQTEKHKLPAAITQTIDHIYELNLNTEVGFRRRNLPSLLGRYFFDMQRVLANFSRTLKLGAPAYVVVGNNHTIAGGERVEIRTHDFIAQLGETVGLRVEEILPMDMLVSRDIFKDNSGTEESIIFFRNLR